MLKLSIFQTLIFSLSIASFPSWAMPFANSDAFSSGDNLAILDLESGLTWLDFGVNNGESINSVVQELNGKYSGWRLPSEGEVRHLWAVLIGNNGKEELWNIFNLWGANKTPNDHSPYFSLGYFIGDDGYLGAAYIYEQELKATSRLSGYYPSSIAVSGVDNKFIDVRYDGSNHILFDLNGSFEISTLLVKKVNVTETPSPQVVIFFMAIFLMFRWLKVSWLFRLNAR